MAVMRLYTVLDRIAEEAGPVFQAVNDGIALRSYRQLLDGVPKVDKAEYRLYFLGTYDSVLMKILPGDVQEVTQYYDAEDQNAKS